MIHAVGPDLVVHTGDILYFVGAMEHLPKVCLDFALHPLIGAGVSRLQLPCVKVDVASFIRTKHLYYIYSLQYAVAG